MKLYTTIKRLNLNVGVSCYVFQRHVDHTPTKRSTRSLTNYIYVHHYLRGYSDHKANWTLSFKEKDQHLSTSFSESRLTSYGSMSELGIKVA